jgi:ribonuclease T2
MQRILVAILCGVFAAAAAPAGAATKSPDYILSLSWEPAFCAGHAAKTECAAETAAGFDATHLSLHGLWPEPFKNQYCGVDAAIVTNDKEGDWKALPAVNLPAATRTRLEAAMPGTRSALERHEWLRHGTCYGSDQATYFGDALGLVDAVNASAVQALLAGNVGKEVTADAIRGAFDKGFGAGAGARVKIACQRVGDRRVISEITIGLVGKPGNGRTLASLMAGSGPTSPGCPSGIVAAVGAQ